MGWCICLVVWVDLCLAFRLSKKTDSYIHIHPKRTDGPWRWETVETMSSSSQKRSFIDRVAYYGVGTCIVRLVFQMSSCYTRKCSQWYFLSMFMVVDFNFLFYLTVENIVIQISLFSIPFHWWLFKLIGIILSVSLSRKSS